MKNRVQAFLVTSALFLSFGQASATIINFDDITAFNVEPEGYTNALVTQGYQGFNWSGGLGTWSWIVTPATAGPVMGFPGTTVTSGGNFAWSNAAKDLALSTVDGRFFDFNALSVRQIWGNGSAIIHGYQGESEIFTETLNLSAEYKRFELNILQVGRITITNQSANLLLDDLEVNRAAVPEPATAALLGLGMLGIGALGRKSAKSNKA
jgi:hypothetical protein